ncbi:2-amino-3-carboxymuconate-6-semialdehyde decarboxylase-like isoform X1 [Clytia hemisphaerica]|uniref:2-amino-3-carboxymuconate-6-semialdehyde decarboxylase n=1 Tax=Clytia hemisphaerica TaxID=252671 RepID=A0A7M5VET7_9CNID|eukprot:TCONS_00071055-protein
MNKIDVHNHILPKDWPNLKERYGYGGFIQLCHCQDGTTDMMKDETFFRKVDPNCFSPEHRLKEMDQTGVTVQVLSTVPVMFSYWAKPEDTLDLSKILNDDLAQTVKKYPKRFIGLGTVPMQAPELAVQELRRCVKDLGFPGIMIGSHINEWNLDAKELFPIFQEAEKLGASIFIHPWDMQLDGRMSKYWLPWLVGMPSESTIAIASLIFGGVLEKLPNLKICLAHGGGAFPYTIGRLAHGHHCRPDLVAVSNPHSPRKYIGRIYTDSLVHDPDALAYLVKAIGEEQVMLGTDYPFPLGELDCGKLIESMTIFDDTLKKKLLWDNCFKFLGMESKFYES